VEDQCELMNDSFGYNNTTLKKDESQRSMSTKEDILRRLLQFLDLEDYFDTFLDHKIYFNDILLLSKDDLVELNIRLGPRNRLLKFIEEYKTTGVDKTFEEYLQQEDKTTPVFERKQTSTLVDEINLKQESPELKHRKTVTTFFKNDKKEEDFHQKNDESFKSNKILEKNYEGLNKEVENFMKKYKEQKEKSVERKNKFSSLIKKETTKSNKLIIKSNERTNNFVFNNKDKTRNLKEELKKSNSITKNDTQPNSKRESNKQSHNMKTVEKENIDNANMLKEIMEKKKMIQLNLSKCKSSIDEKKKLLKLINDKSFKDTDFINKIIQIEDETLTSKVNKSQYSSNFSHTEADFLDDSSHLSHAVYVKKTLKQSFKKK